MRFVPRIITNLLTALAFTAMLPAQAGDPAAPEGLARLRQFVQQVHSVRADFRQELRGSDAKLIEESRGRVILSRPGRFRWDYDKPHERNVVSDGKHVWLYEADLEQVTVRAFAAGLGETPAALLSGGEDVLERFEYVSSWAGEGIQWLRLRPRSAESDFSDIEIGFHGERPIELILHDRLGQETHLYFANVELNARLSAGQFQFQVPPGVDVIREGQM